MSSRPTWPFLHWQANGDCHIDVHVVPHAARTHSEGLFDSALKVRLHARPIEGQANAALLSWLASSLGIAKGHTHWVRGQNARRKRLCIGAAATATAHWTALLP
jgi:uncharacterized protein YggU (UPF0235/DUF167 family)